MTAGVAGFAIGLVIVICLILVGAAFVDRARGRRITEDLPDRMGAEDDLERRKEEQRHYGGTDQL